MARWLSALPQLAPWTAVSISKRSFWQGTLTVVVSGWLG
ncbi:hypothetical protein [Propionibacterium phage Philemon]|uniref:Minor tail protein n=1 Tax=Propionibacterium phage Philemon TaxID=3141823 RepID=A0AAU6VXN0_9VIRU